MKIDTDDWLTLSEVCDQTGIPQRTLYRIAERLGIAENIFGVKVVRKKDIQRIVDDKKLVGNPRWIESYDEASRSAIRAVESRMKRIETEGMTEAEMNRGDRISAAMKKARPAKTLGEVASSSKDTSDDTLRPGSPRSL